MKSKTIILLILLAFSATILISCSNRSDTSSKKDNNSGIVITDEIMDVHGVITKIFDNNTVIMKITKSDFDKSHENNDFKVVYVGGAEKDGTPYKFKVGDKAYFQTIGGGEFSEDDNGEKYWDIISLTKE